MQRRKCLWRTSWNITHYTFLLLNQANLYYISKKSIIFISSNARATSLNTPYFSAEKTLGMKASITLDYLPHLTLCHTWSSVQLCVLLKRSQAKLALHTLVHTQSAGGWLLFFTAKSITRCFWSLLGLDVMENPPTVSIPGMKKSTLQRYRPDSSMLAW